MKCRAIEAGYLARYIHEGEIFECNGPVPDWAEPVQKSEKIAPVSAVSAAGASPAEPERAPEIPAAPPLVPPVPPEIEQADREAREAGRASVDAKAEAGETKREALPPEPAKAKFPKRRGNDDVI